MFRDSVVRIYAFQWSPLWHTVHALSWLNLKLFTGEQFHLEKENNP